MTTIPGNLAADDAETMLQAAPWPALILTEDGRILRWNAAAGAALDPLAEGLNGLRLAYALEDQGLGDANDLRLAIAPEGTDPDAAAAIALLDLGAAASEAGPGDGLTGILGDAVAEMVDMIADRPDLAAAASIGRAVAAILARSSAPTSKDADPLCSVASVAARLLETRRPRFVAQKRTLSAAVDCETPEEAAVPEDALSDCLGAVLDLVAGDPALGDAAIRTSAADDGATVSIDVAVRAASNPAATPRALDLVGVLARLRLGRWGGDATLATPAAGDALLLRVRAPAGARREPAAAKARPGLPDLAHVSILMAEDNLTNQLVATEMLKSMGARLTVASDGAEALERLGGEVFDILLVDIEMPRVSGLEVISRVRAAGGPQAARPIVALTAYAMNEHRARIMEAGADGLIPKPILSIEEFGRSILGYLNGAAPVGRAQKPADPAPTPAAKPTPATAQGGSPVEMGVYRALADAIGPEAMEELLEKVAVDLSDVRAEIDRSAAEGDREGVRRATHILVSVAGSLGAVRLQKMAERMNRLAHEGDDAPVRAAAPEALTELSRLLDFIVDKAGATSR